MRLFIIATSLFLNTIVLGQSSHSNSETIQFNFKQLAVTQQKIKRGDASVMPAYKQLITQANSLLNYKETSVMDKLDIPPSGSKHDYTSLAPYWWPDPNKPNGLPYIKKDGEINPEVKNYPDKENMPKVCKNIYLLGLAYYLSGNEIYAKKATKIASVWFLDTATRMNPNLNFAQVVKGVNNGRGIGIIDTRHFIYALDGIALLQGSVSWDKNKSHAIKQWFNLFLNWLQTSENGMDELVAKNNHGVWYDAQCLGIALYVDSTELAKKIINRALHRLNEQSNNDHLFPLELARTNSLHYSVFNLVAFNVIAQLSEKIGLNIWEYETSDKHSIKKSFLALMPYLKKEQKWTWDEITPYENESSFNLLLTASQKFECTSCQLALKQMAGNNYDQLLLNLF
ncbi:MAG: alginate lyase family protein [Sediminibacterium sp.]|jgi:hypothetical protein